MARTEEEQKGISLLGNQHVAYPSDYSADILETFINKHPDNDYFVKFNCPEFTSLCPITGQPDFATITISYVPDERLVEIVSLPDHPWFIGVQFHPEFKSRPNRPHPLFRGFVTAAAARMNSKK